MAIGLSALFPALLALSSVASAAAPGASGLGDRIFPGAGNGGYQVTHYDLAVTSKKGDRISGLTTMTATSDQALSRFNLDLRKSMKVASVTVDGSEARFQQQRSELIITPSAPLPAGAEFQVQTRYRGKPRADIRGLGYPTGWIPTSDGAWVANQPLGTSTWFPSNNHPSDKASFTFRITVPKGREVVANGVMVGKRSQGKRTTYVWQQVEPMATYLVTAEVGQFKILRGRMAGIPESTAYDPSFGKERRGIKRMRRTSASALRLFSQKFGPYPFASTGMIVDDPEWDRIPYQLETQTRPLYRGVVGSEVVAHEVAHQWFGDSVTPAAWEDVWLNEAMAQWSTWLWRSHRAGKAGKSLQSSFKALYRARGPGSPLWDFVIARPSAEPGQLFNLAIYDRGAMTMEALRQKIGSPDFFRILREWNAHFRYGNADTADFTALCEEISGEDLSTFFKAWIYSSGKPKTW